ncbi:DUF3164 family protein [Tenacibaculum sp. 190524A02b]|uniref:DUF3164 family protein n=1 Tax=Tenacibaculum vairaonense TaxID=3137860 RepID=A0ABP1FJ63_9FLAO
MNVNNLPVEYEIINPNKSMEKSIKNISDEELKKELKRRETEKQEERAAYKETVSETVPQLFLSLQAVSNTLSNCKTAIFKDINNLLSLKNSIYGIKDNQQTHTFSTENGESITIGYRVTDGWDETVGTGITMLNEFLSSLANSEETEKLVKTINRLLKKDNKGNLKANRVIEIKQLADDFGNAKFSDAMDIIIKAYKPVKSSYFIEASYIDKTGEKVSLPLSISSASFINKDSLDLSHFNQKL